MTITNATRKRPIRKSRILKMIESNRRAVKAFGVKTIGLFGSEARETAKSSSDIDILVEFDRSTFDNYMGLKFFLEDLFGKKVDLVLRDALKPALRTTVLDEVVYAQGF